MTRVFMVLDYLTGGLNTNVRNEFRDNLPIDHPTALASFVLPEFLETDIIIRVAPSDE